MANCVDCGKPVRDGCTVCSACSDRRYRVKYGYDLGPRHCEMCGAPINGQGKSPWCRKCSKDIRSGMYDLPPEEPPKKVKEPAWKHAKASGYRYGEMMTKALLRQQKREMAARHKK